MAKYEIQTPKVLDLGPNTLISGFSDAHGSAGDVFLGFFVDLTIGDLTTLQFAMYTENPDGSDVPWMDASNTSIGVTGLAASMTRFFWAGSTNTSNDQLNSHGLVMPSALKVFYLGNKAGVGTEIGLWLVTASVMA